MIFILQEYYNGVAPTTIIGTTIYMEATTLAFRPGFLSYLELSA
jgi:hypothetical protein